MSLLGMLRSMPEVLRATSRFFAQSPHLRPVSGEDMYAVERIERHKNRDAVMAGTALLREVYPSGVRVLLDERDDVLTKALRGCTGRVVGVVGLGHLDGIEKRWAEADGRHKAAQRAVAN
jgi:pheromone shutdown protein TraB